MKTPLFFLIALLLCKGLYAQHTNEPVVIYPLLEEYISDAYSRDIPVYHKIREIDSISSVMMEYPLTGKHHRQGKKEWIELHNVVFRIYSRNLKKTFYHEVGHVFNQPHSSNPHDIMFSGSYELWFEDDTNWQRAKDHYFNQIKQ